MKEERRVNESSCPPGIPRSIGWRLGLQATTGIVFTTFILGQSSSFPFASSTVIGVLATSSKLALSVGSINTFTLKTISPQRPSFFSSPPMFY